MRKEFKSLIASKIWFKSASWFDVHYANSKSIGRFRHIFVAFLNYLNFCKRCEWSWIWIEIQPWTVRMASNMYSWRSKFRKKKKRDYPGWDYSETIFLYKCHYWCSIQQWNGYIWWCEVSHNILIFIVLRIHKFGSGMDKCAKNCYLSAKIISCAKKTGFWLFVCPSNFSRHADATTKQNHSHLWSFKKYSRDALEYEVNLLLSA